LGIAGLDQEIQVDELPIEGMVPSWLSGTLIFNGPGKFEVGDQKYGHWFDGLAMLRRFTFSNSKVSYANRFLQSRGFKAAMDTGGIGFEHFGTNTRPSLFQRLGLLFSSKQFPNNTNINLMKHGSRHLALTETPTTIEFHPRTLATHGEFEFGGRIPATITTAHPHLDYENKTTFNITQKFSLRSSYNIYSLQHGTNQRNLLASVPVSTPSYMHSFGMTEKFIILTEFPLVVHPLKFLWGGRPFIENYQWRPERGTRFLVFRKSNGRSVGIYETEPFFTFHHINAFEQDDSIIMDISAYPEPTIINELYLDHLREDKRRHIPTLEFRRYRIPPSGSTATYEVIFDGPFELPGINYARGNAIEYRYAYALGLNEAGAFDFVNQLVKVNVENGDVKIWYEEGCYPGEPVFVPAPNAQNEDDGLILSVVLDTNCEKSFLLILDASSFGQLAKAVAHHPIPFGFHGQFFEDAL
jgi:carotenoid cleavage dioxygenase-like enzyme